MSAYINGLMIGAVGSTGSSMVINGKSYIIPPGSSVSVINGKLLVNGIEYKEDGISEQDLKRGDLQFNNCTFETFVSSGFQPISISHSEIKKKVSSVSGTIHITGDVGGDVSSVSGTVNIHGDISGDVSTVSGRVSGDSKKRMRK